MPVQTRSPLRGGKWPVIAAWFGVALLVLAGLLMGLAGPAYKAEWISLGTSFGMLRQGAQVALGAAALGLITMVVSGRSRRWRPAIVGLLVSVAVFFMIAVPMEMKHKAQTVPPIHDITTDVETPPAFTLLAAARKEAPNEVEYPGAETARLQQAAYPQLKSITLDVSLASAMDSAKALIQARGWELAGATANTLEATATTSWFGFKDDVVIRMTETGSGIQVDMRSASRVGKSDLGANAGRIQAFLDDLASR
ncbi:DUF1499 domain-containing protein [Marinobacter sp. ANT_B65]|uniref:DUF1499 domain-containing protein n=1 Tax=Marinobacter sp. ANT_B65 TaxID=2039467 RepID=UPI000BBE9F75|nr:DUF1499 domain-containing protein [Marinobacter sp. ANT_B65]PCM46144.1 hypothetical protein CPA50_09425 [Marinobacter sp. ANT_B65]